MINGPHFGWARRRAHPTLTATDSLAAGQTSLSSSCFSPVPPQRQTKKKGIFILKRNKKVIKFYNKIQKSNFNFSTREQKHAHHTSRRQQRQLSLPLFGAKYADSRLQNIPFAPGFTLAHQPVGSAVVLRLSRHSPCPNLLHKSRLPTQQVHALFSNFPIQKEMTETNSKSKLATSSPSQKFGG